MKDCFINLLYFLLFMGSFFVSYLLVDHAPGQGYPPPGMYPPGCPPYCQGVLMPLPRGPDPPRYLGMPRQPPPDMPIITPRRRPPPSPYQEWRCWRFGEC